ncbi:VOC family protein [Halopolyspora algeriensis]|uniref:VOC family protein n=1 Tax=Halopolyspora algeriensis TaxID=1500506 RepID=UPI000DF4A124|nr:VOC family protein [Halopolyspora algeriensis]TQM46569.1 hypothetical protein FHU43_3686 [Halopolyspora algeriensis]
MPARSFEICIDANDPDSLRRFWSVVLGYVEQVTAEEAVDLVDPSGRGPTVWFQRAAEPKTMKDRVHLDLRVSNADRQTLHLHRQAHPADVAGGVSAGQGDGGTRYVTV